MTKLLSIKYTTSKHDRNGNSYSAITVTDLLTGKTGIAKTSSSSNDRSAIFKLFGDDWKNVDQYCHQYEEVLGVREFDRFTKGMPYAGCGSDQIISWVKEATGFTFDAKYAPGRGVLIQMPRQSMSFYTTVQKIRDGVGQDSRFNDDVRLALDLCVSCDIVGVVCERFQLSLV